ncbi:aldo/keto reductase [Novosphingobium album (ex Liu et al. 2023)]|uniref:Aldo/keto reductase n=1 Tax=Novosphingobium album (ex Liu et al. 2023) TaxID=3031130 RepID=A0ABT5WXI0_9SPHN|nr:aldo/keto reductase [Novosphingobium album (ex Liu et al. 2023)]MDE8654611.1 aldo/keto reductase [Novosphingobium album (ex Liu et al. 2023)]
MDYVKLGQTGLEVSPICLGCMSYSQGPTQKHGWLFTEEKSRPFLKRALDLGINFFDTANAYAGGASEETLGNTLLRYAPREEVVITTKVESRMRPGANGQGLSRKAIMTEIDASLRRLKTDYVDIYMIHHWDHATPLEETLEALHDVVKAGKALYIAGSWMHAWQLSKAIQIQRANGWARFIAIQNHLSLLYREEEREMLPLCRDQGVGALPWSPLSRGRLTRPRSETSNRSLTDGYTNTLYPKELDADIEIVDRVLAMAEARGVKPAQVALAWLLSKDEVVAPVMGATKLDHLDDAVAACSLQLTPEEIAHLEEPYRPLPLL